MNKEGKVETRTQVMDLQGGANRQSFARKGSLRQSSQRRENFFRMQ
jgi:hypothetical protein